MKRILLYAGLFLSISIYGMEHSDVENIDEYRFNEDLPVQINEGLLVGTFVKVPFGYIAIEELEIGDRVISRNEHGILETDFVIGIERKKVQEVVQFIVGGEPIIVANDHKFFTPQLKRWIKAHQIGYNHSLMSFPRINAPIESIEIIKGEFEVVSISIENNHNFFVSTKDILVHNMVILWPAGQIITGTVLETALPIAVTLMVPVISGPALIIGGTLIGGTMIANYLKQAETIIELDNEESIRSNSSINIPPCPEQNVEFLPIFMNFLGYEIDIDEEYHYPYIDNQTTFLNANYLCESNKCSLEYWTPAMYEQQWQEGLERLKTHDSSCLINSIPNPLRSDSTVNAWILYKVDNSIHIQNHFLSYDTYGNKTITPENCYDFFIKPRKVFTDDGLDKISEWIVPIVKIPIYNSSLGLLMSVLAMHKIDIKNIGQLRMVANTLGIANISPEFMNL